MRLKAFSVLFPICVFLKKSAKGGCVCESKLKLQLLAMEHKVHIAFILAVNYCHRFQLNTCQQYNPRAGASWIVHESKK